MRKIANLISISGCHGIIAENNARPYREFEQLSETVFGSQNWTSRTPEQKYQLDSRVAGEEVDIGG